MFIHKVRNVFFVLTAFAGILLAGSGLARGLRANRQPEIEPPNREKVADAPRPVTVSRPVQREAAPYQVYTGRLEAHRSVEIRPAMSGFVVKVCFKAGAAVKKGDVLFELDSRSARLTVEKAEAALEGANALAAKRRSEENRWDSEAERLRREVKKGVVDPQVLRESEQQQQISAFARVAAEAAVKAAKIDVARARLELEATTVTAPLSGHADRPLVEAGALVFRGPDRATLLTTITVLDPIDVVFDIDERSYLDYQRLLREKKVKGAGSSLRFQLAGEKGFTHEGTLEWIEGVNPLSSAHVRGNIPNADRILRPGMFVRVRMTLGPPRPVLEVPEEAILSDQGKKYVLVVNERNIAERRAVTLGPADNGKRIIEKGLKADDWVVIAGFAGLHPGDLVAPNKKAAPKRPDSDSPKH